MIDILKYILFAIGIIILICFVFIYIIVSAIYFLAKEDSKTKKYKGKYIDCIRQIFGEDMATCFSVDKCNDKFAIISFHNRFKLETHSHLEPNVMTVYTEHKGWHKITDDVYVFMDDNLNGSTCRFCHDISSRYFRSKMYFDKEEMQNSQFKNTLKSETGWNLPEEAYVIGYIDYSTQQLAPEHIYFCLSDCNLDEIRSQLDMLVSSLEEWTNVENTYHYSKSENYGMSGLNIDYTIGDPFIEVRHFMS